MLYKNLHCTFVPLGNFIPCNKHHDITNMSGCKKICMVVGSTTNFQMVKEIYEIELLKYFTVLIVYRWYDT